MEIQKASQPTGVEPKAPELNDPLELLFAALQQLPQTDEFIPPRDLPPAFNK
jgi:hypothetical protein